MRFSALRKLVFAGSDTGSVSLRDFGSFVESVVKRKQRQNRLIDILSLFFWLDQRIQRSAAGKHRINANKQNDRETQRAAQEFIYMKDHPTTILLSFLVFSLSLFACAVIYCPMPTTMAKVNWRPAKRRQKIEIKAGERTIRIESAFDILCVRRNIQVAREIY